MSEDLKLEDEEATTILPNCGTCHNTGWDLTLALLVDTNNIYSLTITATYGSPVAFVYIKSVAFKIDALTNHYDGVPTVTGPAEDTWGAVFGSISNSSGTGDCSGDGDGFWCAQSLSRGAAGSSNGTSRQNRVTGIPSLHMGHIAAS